MSECDPLLRRRIEGLRVVYGSYAEAARAFGVTPAFICNILHGRSAPSKRILEEIGLRREVVKVERFIDLRAEQ